MKKLFLSVFLTVLFLWFTIPANATVIDTVFFAGMDIESIDYSDYLGKAYSPKGKDNAQEKTCAVFNVVGNKTSPSIYSKDAIKVELTNESTAFPVSEPTTILLLGVGLAGLAGFWRKFKI